MCLVRHQMLKHPGNSIHVFVRFWRITDDFRLRLQQEEKKQISKRLSGELLLPHSVLFFYF